MLVDRRRGEIASKSQYERSPEEKYCLGDLGDLVNGLGEERGEAYAVDSYSCEYTPRNSLSVLGVFGRAHHCWVVTLDGQEVNLLSLLPSTNYGPCPLLGNGIEWEL